MKKIILSLLALVAFASCKQNDEYKKIDATQIKVERLLRENGANTVVIRKDYTVFAVTGCRAETEALFKVLKPYGLIEFVRSGRVAILKGSNEFYDRVKEFHQNIHECSQTKHNYIEEKEKVCSH